MYVYQEGMYLTYAYQDVQENVMYAFYIVTLSCYVYIAGLRMSVIFTAKSFPSKLK